MHLLVSCVQVPDDDNDDDNDLMTMCYLMARDAPIVKTSLAG